MVQKSGKPVEVGSLSPSFTRCQNIPGGCLGFLPSTVGHAGLLFWRWMIYQRLLSFFSPQNTTRFYFQCSYNLGNLQYFTNLCFPEIRGCSLLNHHLGWGPLVKKNHQVSIHPLNPSCILSEPLFIGILNKSRLLGSWNLKGQYTKQNDFGNHHFQLIKIKDRCIVYLYIYIYVANVISQSISIWPNHNISPSPKFPWNSRILLCPFQNATELGGPGRYPFAPRPPSSNPPEQ